MLGIRKEGILGKDEMKSWTEFVQEPRHQQYQHFRWQLSAFGGKTVMLLKLPSRMFTEYQVDLRRL